MITGCSAQRETSGSGASGLGAVADAAHGEAQDGGQCLVKATWAVTL